MRISSSRALAQWAITSLLAAEVTVRGWGVATCAATSWSSVRVRVQTVIGASIAGRLALGILVVVVMVIGMGCVGERNLCWVVCGGGRGRYVVSEAEETYLFYLHTSLR